MFRRRRKAPVVWLPPSVEDRMVPGQGTITNPTQTAIGRVVLTAPGAQGSTSTFGVGVVGDTNTNLMAGGANAAGIFGSLADVEAGAYRLRRVVGKIFAGAYQDLTSDDAAYSWVVTAGLLVNEVDDTGQPWQICSPSTYQAQRDPWIWRRSWLLQNAVNAAAANTQAPIYPTSNSFYNSVQDGPHIDQKTARVISNEQRLYLWVDVTAVNGSNAQVDDSIELIWDLRFVASMRKQAGNRRNASR